MFRRISRGFQSPVEPRVRWGVQDSQGIIGVFLLLLSFLQVFARTVDEMDSSSSLIESPFQFRSYVNNLGRLGKYFAGFNCFWFK